MGSSSSRGRPGAWTSTRCCFGSIPRRPGCACWRPNRRRASSPGISSPSATRTSGLCPRQNGERGWKRCSTRPRRRSTSPLRLATAPSPPSGSSDSRAPAWMASSPSASRPSTSPASGRCSRSSTSARRIAWWPASAGTRTAPAHWSARSCSGCSTAPARSTTWASLRPSRWRVGPSSCRNWLPFGSPRWTATPGRSGRPGRNRAVPRQRRPSRAVCCRRRPRPPGH